MNKFYIIVLLSLCFVSGCIDNDPTNEAPNTVDYYQQWLDVTPHIHILGEISDVQTFDVAWGDQWYNGHETICLVLFENASSVTTLGEDFFHDPFNLSRFDTESEHVYSQELSMGYYGKFVSHKGKTVYFYCYDQGELNSGRPKSYAVRDFKVINNES